MKCIIIDDEQLARTLLENFIQKISSVDVVGIYKNPSDARPAIEQGLVDLIITDIQMPGTLGSEFIKTLDNPPLVIFTTAYKDYALEGFELDAVDYLLKPFSFERFEKAIGKALSYFELKNKELSSPDLKADYLTIKADHKLYKVHYTDISYIEGMREYVSFHTTTGRITALMSLKYLENNLPKSIFVRSHKSYIVNKHLVQALEGNQLLIKDKQIPIGQMYRDEVMKEVF